MQPQAPWSIGSVALTGRVMAAPMAGVSDRIFRDLAREHGAALAASEMIATQPALMNTTQTRRRLDHKGESGLNCVHLLGAAPEQMALAAQRGVEQGARLIDINLGCPAKKVCKKLVGSALMRDEPLVAEILAAVVSAVRVPVTLKMRTGWSPDQRNAVRIARLAEAIGISAVAVHGRTRQCKYQGTVEYDTVRAVKKAVSIPVIANGDIDSPLKAREVLSYTKADAVMIGRAAQGNPWLFGRVDCFLKEGRDPGNPTAAEIRETLLRHLEALYVFYGLRDGPRIARKHFSWYVCAQGGEVAGRRLFCSAIDPATQLQIARSMNFEPASPSGNEINEKKNSPTSVSIR